VGEKTLKQILITAIFAMFFMSVVFAAVPYNESLTNHENIEEVNEYVSKVSAFIHEKCKPPFCRHIVIVGDDYVVPYARLKNTELTAEQMLSPENSMIRIILSDYPYITKSVKQITDANSLFDNNQKIAIVVPNDATTEMLVAVNALKTELMQKYSVGSSDISQYYANQINCAPSSNHILAGKTIVIVGANNAVRNCSISFRNYETFSITRNPWGDKLGQSKEVILLNTDVPELIQNAMKIINSPQTFFAGRIDDTDGDGWSDYEEVLMHTKLDDPNDNHCTRLLSLKTIATEIREPGYWTNALTTFLAQQASVQGVSAQSNWMVPAFLTGIAAGGVLGITGGIESDIDFFLHLDQVIGGIILITISPNSWLSAADALSSSEFFGQSQTECQIQKATQNNYFNNVLPALWEKAALTRPAIQADWDADDKKAFDSAFVTSYHAGFIFWQVVLFEKTTLEAGKLLKEAKFLTKAGQAVKAEVQAIMGEFRLIGWTTKASKGLENIIAEFGGSKARQIINTYANVDVSKTIFEHAENTSALSNNYRVPNTMVHFREATENVTAIGSGSGRAFVSDSSYYQDILNKINGTQISRQTVKELEGVLLMDKGQLSKFNRIAMVKVSNIESRAGFKIPETGDAFGPFFVPGRGTTLANVPERVIGPLSTSEVGVQVDYLTVVD
jgi:hypothetical protein